MYGQMTSFLALNYKDYEAETIGASSPSTDWVATETAGWWSVNVMTYLERHRYFYRRVNHNRAEYENKFGDDKYEMMTSLMGHMLCIHIETADSHFWLLDIPHDALNLIAELDMDIDMSLTLVPAAKDVRALSPSRMQELARWFHGKYGTSPIQLESLVRIYESYASLLVAMNAVEPEAEPAWAPSSSMVYCEWNRSTFAAGLSANWLLDNCPHFRRIDTLEWCGAAKANLVLCCHNVTWEEAVDRYTKMKALMSMPQDPAINDICQYIIDNFVASEDKFVAERFLYKCLMHDRCMNHDTTALKESLKILGITRKRINGRVHYGLRAKFDQPASMRRSDTIQERLSGRLMSAFHAAYEVTRNINDQMDMVIVFEDLKKRSGLAASAFTDALLMDLVYSLRLHIVGEDLAGLRPISR
jgi:hypothetical protein